MAGYANKIVSTVGAFVAAAGVATTTLPKPAEAGQERGPNGTVIAVCHNLSGTRVAIRQGGYGYNSCLRSDRDFQLYQFSGQVQNRPYGGIHAGQRVDFPNFAPGAYCIGGDNFKGIDRECYTNGQRSEGVSREQVGQATTTRQALVAKFG